MAEFRTVYTKIWDDEWFIDLDTEAKLLWLYLITNQRASVAGIYPLRPGIAAIESGLPLEQVTDILSSFADMNKIAHDGKVVWVKRLREYQETRSESVQTRIKKDIAAIGDCDIKRAYLKHYGYPAHSLPTPCRHPLKKTCGDTVTDTDTDTDTETSPAIAGTSTVDGESAETAEPASPGGGDDGKQECREYLLFLCNGGRVDDVGWQSLEDMMTEHGTEHTLEALKTAGNNGVRGQRVLAYIATVLSKRHDKQSRWMMGWSV